MRNSQGDPNSPARVFVLLSGGVDSAACAGFFLQRNHHVEAIHLDYGQAAADSEYASAQAIAKHYEVKLHYHRMTDASRKGAGQIVGRNAFLLFSALLEFPWDVGLLGLGVHAGTQYFDCASEFIERAQRLFDSYTNGRIKISAPFLTWEKPQIWNFCLDAKVPLALTYSCESRSSEPCGQCSSCKDLEALRGR